MGHWLWKPSVQGEGHLPKVFQCTWHTTVDEKTKQHWGHYFLGASTAGDRFNQAYTGSWRESVQEARFDMLLTCQKVFMVQRNDFKDKRAPSQMDSKGSQVPFGNCAETYPFVTRFLGDKTKNGSMAGLALQREFMAEEEYPEYDPYTDGEIWKNLLGPCGNCRELMKRARADISKFSTNLDKDKAPKRPSEPLAKAE